MTKEVITFEPWEWVYVISSPSQFRQLIPTSKEDRFNLLVTSAIGTRLVDNEGLDEHGNIVICKITDENCKKLRVLKPNINVPSPDTFQKDNWFYIVEGVAIVVSEFGFEDFYESVTGTSIDDVAYVVERPSYYPSVVTLTHESDIDDDYWVASSIRLENFTQAINEYNKIY